MGGYVFRSDEQERITSRFGGDFYGKLVGDLDVYTEKWRLDALSLIPSYSANLVFLCHSEDYGDAVLKIGDPAFPETRSEYLALRHFDGGRFCRVFAVDADKGALLIEHVKPGIPLRKELSLDKRLSVFCSLYRGLHAEPAEPERFPSYTGWVNRITEYMSQRQDCVELYEHMKKAREICLEVARRYTQKMLLHGDFHHDNILLGAGGEYRIIDPKGVVGDPVFDVPRFILNEFDNEITDGLFDKINSIVMALEESLRIPQGILRKCLYVETAMGMCWCVESGAGPEEMAKLMQTVVFAEAVLNH